MDEQTKLGEPALGVSIGGIHTAEALLWARYLMFTQLYFHHVRRIYGIHLKDFLFKWLPGGKFPTDVEELLKITDNEVNAALLEAATNVSRAGHDPAVRIVDHKHFKCVYFRHPEDVRANPDAGRSVYRKAVEQFGDANVRYDRPPSKSSGTDFPVMTADGRIVSSLEVSVPLAKVPPIAAEYVYVDRDILDRARKWLKDNRKEIIEPGRETE